MKNGKKNVNQARNQFIKLLLDQTFREFVKIERDLLLKRQAESNNYYRAVTECKSRIQKFLFLSKLPVIWIEPIFTFIKDEKDVKLPLENGVDIKVGDTLLSSAGDTITIIRKDGIPSKQDSELSIVISTQVSINKIIDFIEKNAETIRYLQKSLQLPSHDYMSWDNIDLAIEVIRMKDENKMSFSQIMDELNNRPNNKQDYDESHVKNVYYRFKERLSNIK
ncbi:MAG: hypothetical protein WAV30_03870 [Microgenomates group bacterium]